MLGAVVPFTLTVAELRGAYYIIPGSYISGAHPLVPIPLLPLPNYPTSCNPFPHFWNGDALTSECIHIGVVGGEQANEIQWMLTGPHHKSSTMICFVVIWPTASNWWMVSSKGVWQKGHDLSFNLCPTLWGGKPNNNNNHRTGENIPLNECQK